MIRNFQSFERIISSILPFVLSKNNKIIFIFTMVLMAQKVAISQTIVSLYNTVPNSKIASDYREKSDTGSDGVIRVSNVAAPELVIYKPGLHSENNTSVIICPGGGYGILAYNLEGTEVAKILNSWGVTAIVLKYRLPSDVIMINKSIGPLQDAQRAIQYVREHAKELSIDPGKVGIMGFSAGGHLAATLSTHFDSNYISNPQNTLLRPDFSVLAYPVISLVDTITHSGSRNNLIGKNPSPELIEKFSNELQVNSTTPPAFLVLASDDKAVNPQNSIRYYEALLKANVPAELHIYQNGGHGFGTHNATTKDDWMIRLKYWMVHNHFLQEK